MTGSDEVSGMKEAGMADIQALCRAATRKAAESARTLESFVSANAGRIAEAASRMAARFQDGGRLFVMGNGGSACDAEHTMVEFMHPIFETRRALPCLALSANTALVSAVANDSDFSLVFADQLRRLAGPCDMALFVSTSGMSSNLVAGARAASELGLFTLAFSGRDGGRIAGMVDCALTVESYSTHRIQEAHVLALHLLWDLVHLALGEQDIV